MMDLEEKIIKYKDVEWKYILNKKDCNTTTKYYINFTYPTRLQVSTAKSVFEDLEKNAGDNIIKKLESAIKSKYDSKVKDSFNTKYKMFVFYKYFEFNNTSCDSNPFDEYFSNPDEVKKDFFTFSISTKLADVFSSQYYQKQPHEYVIFDNKRKTVKEITDKLFAYDCNGNKTYNKCYVFDMTKETYRSDATKHDKNIILLYVSLLEDYRNKNKFTICDFTKLLSQTSCTYCGITIEQIHKLNQKNAIHNKRSETRGYSLEIDRKHPNLEYSSDNCCMSCYWCNNAKTDEFSYDEFKNCIAPGIRNIWNSRLGKTGLIPDTANEKCSKAK